VPRYFLGHGMLGLADITLLASENDDVAPVRIEDIV